MNVRSAIRKNLNAPQNLQLQVQFDLKTTEAAILLPVTAAAINQRHCCCHFASHT